MFENVIFDFKQAISQVTWHGKGDYFASVVPQGKSLCCLLNKPSGYTKIINRAAVGVRRSWFAFGLFYNCFFVSFVGEQIKIVLFLLADRTGFAVKSKLKIEKLNILIWTKYNEHLSVEH